MPFDAAAPDAFDGLPRGFFSVILMDFPWKYEGWTEGSAFHRGPDRHYRTMSFDEGLALPVGTLAARRCALFMWSTQGHLAQAIDLMRGWGFEFSTAASWRKRSKHGKGHMGTGYFLRGEAEFYLVGRPSKGQLPPVKSKAVRNFIEAPVGRHSQKPEQLYRDIEALCDGPYLEIFARRQRPGWWAYGNEVEAAEAAC